MHEIVARAGSSKPTVYRVGARDPDLDVDLILGALYFRVLMRRQRVPARFAAELARRLYPRAPRATRAVRARRSVST